MKLIYNNFLSLQAVLSSGAVYDAVQRGSKFSVFG